MAGGARTNGEDEGITDINITPFVDVVLVLLVIFMVTAGIIVKRGLNIQLPQAATAEQLQQQTTFNILIARNGDIALDGKSVTVEELKRRGTEARAKTEKVVAMISADKGVIYSYVVGTMDALREVGVADFALQLEQIPTVKVTPTP